jgi:hypothetical protein
MNTKERFLNVLDGVLLALAMAWTLTFATALFHPAAQPVPAQDLRAAITDQASDL